MTITPKVSIIIPVYNVELYLRRCLDSILSQTYTDWECILVNDGSNDNSGKICDEYANNDSRFRVFHKANGGVSSARNFGIDKATSEWITFVDSDDWVEKDYIYVMFKDNQNSDFSIQGYKIVPHRGNEVIHKFENSFYTSDILSIFCESEYKNIINSPVSKLFKTNIIREYNIEFDKTISYGEDHIFVLEYLKYVNVIYISNAFEYNYYQDDSISLTRKPIHSSQLISYMVLAFNKQLALIHQFNATDNDAALSAVARRFYGVYSKLLYDFFLSSPNIEKYANIINSLRPYRMKKTDLTIKRKFIFNIIEKIPLKLSYIMLSYYYHKL